MANKRHVALLRRSVPDWNLWRAAHPRVVPNFEGASLRALDLIGADLAGANLSGADLTYAFLTEARLQGAVLRNAKLVETNFVRADLRGAEMASVVVNGANFRDADLRTANLADANLGAASFVATDLREASLARADLTYCRFIEARLEGADLTACRVYGVSAWGLQLAGATQINLIVTRGDEPDITVDNLEVAQFVYLLLHNPKVREVIETITSKVVLILGRFTPRRKPVLDALRTALRAHNYSPILFDFDRPAGRDLTETISTLAHLAKFIVADITDAASVPQELGRIVPGLPSVPVMPLLEHGSGEYAMFEHFRRYPWVLPLHRYDGVDGLLGSLDSDVIGPAEAKAREQRMSTA